MGSLVAFRRLGGHHQHRCCLSGLQAGLKALLAKPGQVVSQWATSKETPLPLLSEQQG